MSGRRDIKSIKRSQLPPDLVVEVLSDSDRAELPGKLDDYRAFGVHEAWLVDSEAELVTVLRLADDVRSACSAEATPSIRKCCPSSN